LSLGIGLAILFVHHRNYKGVIKDYENICASVLLNEFERESMDKECIQPIRHYVFQNDLKKERVMTPMRPTQEDIRKLHSEVNQIVNQRLTVTTLSVTVFAVIIAWLIPRDSVGIATEVGLFRFAAVILLIVVLFSLFLLTHHLSAMLRLITTYLEITDASIWEKDWSTYRKQYRYIGYTIPQAMIFLLLGVLSTVFPLLLGLAYKIKLEPLGYAILCFGLGCLYIIGVIGMGFWRWGAKEDQFKEQWQKLLELKDR
jgi:hypothetical protein